MIAPFAVDLRDAVVDALFFFYAFGLQTITCMVLGYFVARRTTRSAFNWLATGFLAGLIPVAGIVFMVVALLFYPPPAPSSKPGYHPPKTTDRDARRRGASRPRGGR